MKTLHRTKHDPGFAFLIFLMLLVSRCREQAQGTVFFDNLDVRGVNAPVYESDGVTPLSGPQFMAELLAGPSADTLMTVASTGFLPGGGAGYFNAGTVSISGVGPGALAWAQVDVWNAASGLSFSQAKASGLGSSWWQSSVFSVQTGNPGVPSTPGALTGLGTSRVYLNSVPEPCALDLAGLGAALALLGAWRRRGLGSS